MYVEERGFGVTLTPELTALAEMVFMRSFARIAVHADHVRVRLFAVREGIECRAMLRPHAGATMASRETRHTAIEALLASATGLAHQLERRVVMRSRRGRRQRGSTGRAPAGRRPDPFRA